MRKSPIKQIAGVGVLLLMLCILLLVIAGAAQVYYAAHIASARWAAVPARIAASTIERGCGRGGHSFAAIVQFHYVIADVTFTSERIWFGGAFCGDVGEAAAIAARWPAGSEVRAYVDPADPAAAVLVRDAAPGIGMLLVTASMFLLLMLLMAAWCWLARRAHRTLLRNGYLS